MKYFTGFLGMFIGMTVADFFTDSRAVEWIVGIILALIFYKIPAFYSHTKSNPKKFLAFHGPDAPITRSKSKGELDTALTHLHKGGLLRGVFLKEGRIAVNAQQWNTLEESEKLTFQQICDRSASLQTGIPFIALRVTDELGNTLRDPISLETD